MFATFDSNAAVPGPSPSGSASPKPAIKPSRRRDKPQVSCVACRLKKLKCDRLRPCSNCSKRSQLGSCDYVTNDTKRSRPQVTANVQDRVRHLEKIVVTLMNSQVGLEHGNRSAERQSSAGPVQDDGFTQSPAASADKQSDPGEPEASRGKFTKAKDQVNFVGSGHWEAILDDIAELKVDLENTDTSEMVDFKPQILFGINNYATRSEIISSVPPRPLCDMLLARWFNVNDMAPMVIHAPTFMKEYDQAWKNPDGTPLMWFGLLFSILGHASYFYVMTGDELHTLPEPFTSISEMVSHYRDRTAQCLVEVNYLKPVRYTVDALCLYYALEIFQAKDSEFGAYMVLGIIVRVAMRLGYHRDASHYPSISPFDGEMRRRTWCLIFQLDLITSVLVGLPRMIREGETDTAEPKNLLDADFDDNMTELPRPRPSTDLTPVAYAIFKTRILRQLGLVLDHMNATIPPAYDEVMRLDSQLTATHATLPPCLTLRPLSLCLTDRADLIFRRYALEVGFQKSRCLLHRKYLIAGHSNPQYRYSRTTSVDAAMKLLDIKCIVHEAIQPGGPLYRERWRMNGLIGQDYVLAAMILCLDLDWDMGSGKSYDQDDVERMWPRDTRLQKLKQSYEVWAESSRTSARAAKAAEALRVMFKRLNIGNLQTTHERPVAPTCSMPELITASNPASSTDTTPARQLSPHEDLPSFDTTENFDPNTQCFPESSTTEFISGMIDTEMNFDWGLWDSHFQTISTNSIEIGLQDFGSFTFQ